MLCVRRTAHLLRQRQRPRVPLEGSTTGRRGRPATNVAGNASAAGSLVTTDSSARIANFVGHEAMATHAPPLECRFLSFFLLAMRSLQSIY